LGRWSLKSEGANDKKEKTLEKMGRSRHITRKRFFEVAIFSQYVPTCSSLKISTFFRRWLVTKQGEVQMIKKRIFLEKMGLTRKILRKCFFEVAICRK